MPLFNGRNLDGWVNVNCAPTTWSVRDGMINSTGKPICELRTARMFENFILELEYQHLDPQGNAGVFIWGDALTAPGQPFVRAIEVQVLDGRNTDNYTSHGDVFAIHGARMTPDRPHPGGWMRSLPTERRARPAGEWNHYRITALNGTLKLAVNGKEVSGGYDITPRKGYIHLESEGGRVLYRNLRVKELPPAPALPPDQIAQADEGFVSIYTGVDFSGWQYPKGHEGHWTSKDWVIAYDGKSEAAEKDLRTEKAFGDVSIIADWRSTSGSGSGDAADRDRGRGVARRGAGRNRSSALDAAARRRVAARDPDQACRAPLTRRRPSDARRKCGARRCCRPRPVRPPARRPSDRVRQCVHQAILNAEYSPFTSAFSIQHCLDDDLADEGRLTGRVARRVDILGAEYREHAGADRHELAAGLEERDVARCIVGFALPQLSESRDAHPLRARHHELHVDVSPVRLPHALVRRARRVLLHEGEQPIAVEIVPPERYRAHVGRAQVLERPGQTERQLVERTTHSRADR